MATSPENFSHSPLRPIPVAEGPVTILGAVEGSANRTDYSPLDTETSELDETASASETETERAEFLDTVKKFFTEHEKAANYLEDLKVAGYPYDDSEKIDKLYALQTEVEGIFKKWDLSTVAYEAEALKLNKVRVLRACAEIEVIKIAIERFAISKGLITNDKPGESTEKDSGNEKAEALIALHVTPAYEKLKRAEERLAALWTRKEQQLKENIIKPSSRLDRLFGEAKNFFDTRKINTSIDEAIKTLERSIQSGEKIDGPLRLVTNKLASAEEKLAVIEKKLNAVTVSNMPAEVMPPVTPELSITAESVEVSGVSEDPLDIDLDKIKTDDTLDIDLEALERPGANPNNFKFSGPLDIDLSLSNGQVALDIDLDKTAEPDLARAEEISVETPGHKTAEINPLSGEAYVNRYNPEDFHEDIRTYMEGYNTIFNRIRQVQVFTAKHGLPDDETQLTLERISDLFDNPFNDNSLEGHLLTIIDADENRPVNDKERERFFKAETELSALLDDLDGRIQPSTLHLLEVIEFTTDLLTTTPQSYAELDQATAAIVDEFNRLVEDRAELRYTYCALESATAKVIRRFLARREVTETHPAQDPGRDRAEVFGLFNEVQVKMTAHLEEMKSLRTQAAENTGIHDPGLASLEDDKEDFAYSNNEKHDEIMNERLLTSEEEIAKIKKYGEQILRLDGYLVTKGESLSPELVLFKSYVETAVSNYEHETDQMVKKNNLEKAYRVLNKAWKPLYAKLGTEYRLIAADLDPAESQVKEASQPSPERALYRDLNRKFNGYHTHEIDSVTGKEKITDHDGIRKQYETALEKFYKEQSYFGQAKNYLGFKPKLPEPLVSLQEEYEDMGQAYAVALDAVLRARGTDNSGVDPALAEKFIFKERRRQLNVQKEVALGKEKTSKIKPIMDVLRKHKWLIRGGVVGGYALAGAFVVGGTALAFGGFAAARMAASLGVGGLAGKTAFGAMQSKVDQAVAGVTQAENRARTEFRVDKLGDLRQGIQTADDNKATAEGRQRLATGVAAVAAGGLTGFGSSFFASDVMTGGSGQQPETPMPAPRGGSVTEGSSMSGSSGEPAAVTKATEAGTTIPEIKRVGLVSAFNVSAEPTVAGGEAVTVSVSKIDLLGNELNVEALGNHKAEVIQYLKDRTDDLIADNPKVSQVKLEAQLLADLQNRYGASDWWGSAKITGIDVEEIREFKVSVEPVRPAANNPAEVAPLNKAEAIPQTEAALGAYEVKTGDTLTKIVTEKFASDLQKLASESRTSAVAELMNRARVDGALRDSLSLRSDGNIDRIYAGEEIKLKGLEAELQKIITERSGARISAAEEPISTRPKTGNLTVNRLDNGGSIPVRFAGVPAEPADFGASVTPERGLPVEGGRQVAANDRQFVQTVYKFPEPPKVFSLSGNFTETADYQTFIKEHYGTTQQFNKIVATEVKSFDEATYTSLEKFMKGEGFHVSPYEKFSGMTLAQIEQFEKELNMSEFGEYKQMNYNTYKAWMDRIEDMKARHEWSQTTTLADLLARDVAEAGVRARAEEKTLLRA